MWRSSAARWPILPRKASRRRLTLSFKPSFLRTSPPSLILMTLIRYVRLLTYILAGGPNGCLSWQESLWKTLNDSPLFHPTETSSTSEPPRWSYHVPDPATQSTPPLLPALTKLQSSVAQAVSARPTHRFQHTLQSLIDFTGYLTTKTYALASAMHRLPGTTPSSATAIEEEEIRMEIKALKGLVLNRCVSPFPIRKCFRATPHSPTDRCRYRRTFIPAIARPSSAPIAGP